MKEVWNNLQLEWYNNMHEGFVEGEKFVKALEEDPKNFKGEKDRLSQQVLIQKWKLPKMKGWSHYAHTNFFFFAYFFLLFFSESNFTLKSCYSIFNWTKLWKVANFHKNGTFLYRTAKSTFIFDSMMHCLFTYQFKSLFVMSPVPSVLLNLRRPIVMKLQIIPRPLGARTDWSRYRGGARFCNLTRFCQIIRVEQKEM